MILDDIEKALALCNRADDMLLNIRNEENVTADEYFKASYQSLSNVLNFRNFIVAKKIHMISMCAIFKKFHLMPENWMPGFTSISRQQINDELLFDDMWEVEQEQYQILEDVIRNSSWNLTMLDMNELLLDSYSAAFKFNREHVDIETLTELDYNDMERVVNACKHELEKICGKDVAKEYQDYFRIWLSHAANRSVFYTDVCMIAHNKLSDFMENFELFSKVLPTRIVSIFSELKAKMSLLYFVQYSAYDQKDKIIHDNFYTIWESGYAIKCEDTVSHLHVTAAGLASYPLMDMFLQYMEQEYPNIFMKGGSAENESENAEIA